MGKIAYLHIETWVGSCLSFAQHFYGKITTKTNLPSIDIRHTLTESDAKRLNKDREEWNDYVHKIGDTSDQYYEKERLIKDGIKEFNTNPLLKDFDLLIEGDKDVFSPQKPLVCSDNHFLCKLKSIYEAFKQLNGYECEKEDEEKVNTLYVQWATFIERYEEGKNENIYR